MSVTTAGPVRIHQSGRRIAIYADVTPARFAGAFKVTLATQDSVQVALGTVNGQTPAINGVALDGLDESGQQQGLPTIDISEGPLDKFRSWVCVQATIDPTPGKDGSINPIFTDLTIIHSPDITDKFINGFGVDNGHGAGIFPLAMIRWKDGSPNRILRNTYFNQTHAFLPNTVGKNGKAWHIFRPSSL